MCFLIACTKNLTETDAFIRRYVSHVWVVARGKFSLHSQFLPNRVSVCVCVCVRPVCPEKVL